ncbi:MAG: type II toxin-antitoxin system RatA family toxin [bacterium]
MLTEIRRSALLNHSAHQMYRLVNDIEAYPQFMNGCVGAAVLEDMPEMMVARLDLKQRSISTSFTTRNRLVPDQRIDMQLEEGPFKRLQGVWTFKPLTESACKVSLELAFEFKSVSVAVAASSLFSSVANNLLDAVVARAAIIYA